MENTQTTNETKLPVINIQDLTPSNHSAGELASKIVDAILSGYVNPLDFAVKKKCIEEALDLAFTNSFVRDAMIEEAAKHNGKAVHLGAKVESCEVGVRYLFDKCNDPKLVQLETEAAELADKVKQRKEWLKKVDTKGEKILIDDEVIEVYPPAKTSTTSIKVSLAK